MFNSEEEKLQENQPQAAIVKAPTETAIKVEDDQVKPEGDDAE